MGPVQGRGTSGLARPVGWVGRMPQCPALSATVPSGCPAGREEPRPGCDGRVGGHRRGHQARNDPPGDCGTAGGTAPLVLPAHEVGHRATLGREREFNDGGVRWPLPRLNSAAPSAATDSPWTGGTPMTGRLHRHTGPCAPRLPKAGGRRCPSRAAHSPLATPARRVRARPQQKCCSGTPAHAAAACGNAPRQVRRPAGARLRADSPPCSERWSASVDHPSKKQVHNRTYEELVSDWRRICMLPPDFGAARRRRRSGARCRTAVRRTPCQGLKSPAQGEL
jgi:hypothetical protein